VAKEIAQGKSPCADITPELVEEYLGPRKFFNEAAAEKDRAGVVTGLAWTETGGDIIFIEATKMMGKGELILTGSLGNVMKESARAALSFVQANCAEWAIPDNAFNDMNIHIHVPAGSIPKDGPSAGITMATVLIYMMKGKPVRKKLGMTGELTLTGRVLPIGGLKEKTIAARRAGLKVLIFPEGNRKDFDELADYLKEGLEVHFAKEYKDVYKVAFGKG
jgi:ATP-dependent Lon protease